MSSWFVVDLRIVEESVELPLRPSSASAAMIARDPSCVSLAGKGDPNGWD